MYALNRASQCPVLQSLLTFDFSHDNSILLLTSFSAGGRLKRREQRFLQIMQKGGIFGNKCSTEKCLITNDQPNF